MDTSKLDWLALNRLVAIEVLGWTPLEPNNHYTDWRLPDGSTIGCWEYLDHKFSDSWEGLGMVVAKMREKGRVFELTDYHDAKQYTAMFYPLGSTDSVEGQATNSEAPRAGALAAVEACKKAKEGA